jgi:hypothetical protein
MGKLESNRRQLKQKVMEYRTNKKFPTLNQRTDQELAFLVKSNFPVMKKNFAAKITPKKDEKFN